MAEQLRALGSVTSTYTMTQPSIAAVPGDSTPSSGLSWHYIHAVQTYICMQNTDAHKVFLN